MVEEALVTGHLALLGANCEVELAQREAPVFAHPSEVGDVGNVAQQGLLQFFLDFARVVENVVKSVA